MPFQDCPLGWKLASQGEVDPLELEQMLFAAAPGQDDRLSLVKDCLRNTDQTCLFTLLKLSRPQ